MKNSLFAVKTITKIITKRFFRDRTALFFTIAFPLIFLVIFGALFGSNDHVSFRVAVINQSSAPFAQEFTESIKANKVFEVQSEVNNLEAAKQQMNRSQLSAAIVLPPEFGELGEVGHPRGEAVVYYNQNNQQAAQTLQAILDSVFEGINARFVQTDMPFTVRTESTNTTSISQFDYIFAGMLGFAILGLGIFGPTNGFPEAKKQGILRRLRTTPLTTAQFVIGNALSYAFVGLIAIIVLFIVGLTMFDLQMKGSYLTVAVFSIIGILALFGIGIAIGGWAKNEQQAAPLSNLVAFPMMFLSGVFFPTFLMPEWLQRISQYLPLTPIVDGARMIITEGRSLLQLGPELAVIAVWMIVIYALAFRIFRWE